MSETRSDVSSALVCGDGDDLALEHIHLDNVPDDILFPEELMQYLRGQVQFLSQANARLEQNLREKEIEVQNYEVKTNDLNSKISEYDMVTRELSCHSLTVGSSKLLSTKIVDLSKKLREKNAEIESLKTRCSKLEQKIVFAQNEKNDKEEMCKESKKNIRTDTNCYADQIKILQDKLIVANSKLFEAKNQNVQLKNDVKLANKIMLAELGDNFTSIQNYIINPAGWRGRSQQILALQQKNNELLERITLLSDKDAMSTIGAKTDNRKQIIEQLNKEVSSLKTELEEGRKKQASARARIKVLETECFALKNKMTAQTEKISSDDQVINLLKNQITCMEDSQANLLKEHQAANEQRQKQHLTELSRERCKLENLQRQLADSEASLYQLRSEMMPGKPGLHCNSLTSLNYKETSTKLNMLEVETRRLTELCAVLNNRLENERTGHADCQAQLRRERQRAARLETRVLRLEMESSMCRPQAYGKSVSRFSSSLTSPSTNSESPGSPLTIDNLKNSLELAEEQIKALEQRLVILQREKDMDFQRFTTILNDTNNILKRSEIITQVVVTRLFKQDWS